LRFRAYDLGFRTDLQKTAELSDVCGLGLKIQDLGFRADLQKTAELNDISVRLEKDLHPKSRGEAQDLVHVIKASRKLPFMSVEVYSVLDDVLGHALVLEETCTATTEMRK